MREYSHEMLEQVDIKNLPDLLIQLDGLAAANVATIINECKQPSNDFIY